MSGRAVSGGNRPDPAGQDPSGAARHPTSPPAPGAALVTGAGGDHDWGWSVSGPGAGRRDPAVLAKLVETHGGTTGGWCPTCDEWECLPGVVARQGLVSLLVEGHGAGHFRR